MFNQTMPSGVYSALEDDQIIESVLFSNNDVITRWISKMDWIFSLNIPGFYHLCSIFECFNQFFHCIQYLISN